MQITGGSFPPLPPEEAVAERCIRTPGGLSAALPPLVVALAVVPAAWAEAGQAAAHRGPADALLRIFFWLAVMLAVVAVGIFILRWARRRLNAAADGQPTSFTLADLRRMHREGQLDDAEYEAARRQLIITYQRQASPPPEGPPPEEPPPGVRPPQGMPPQGRSPQGRTPQAPHRPDQPPEGPEGDARQRSARDIDDPSAAGPSETASAPDGHGEAAPPPGPPTDHPDAPSRRFGPDLGDRDDLPDDADRQEGGEGNDDSGPKPA